MRADALLPYGRQSIDDADVTAVVDVLRGDFLTGGPAVAGFEQTFAGAVGVRHAVSCSSGTAALHLAMLALGLGEGDAVIVPSLTFLATANAARFVNAEVVFADVDPEHGLLTPETLEAAVSVAGRKVKAIVPVHLNGQSCDMAAIAQVAGRHGLTVVEDACHALGGAGVGACAYSAMAAFSLHPVKVIAGGEGGVVSTNDDALAERLSRYRNHGMVREASRFEMADQAFDKSGSANPWYYEMPEVGYNYRLSDIHAALAGSQLGRLESFSRRRQALAGRYDAALAELAPVIKPVARRPGENPVWHLYAVLIDFGALGLTRADVMHRLREAGIGTQVHYLPVHRQPYYARRYGKQSLPGADAYYERVLSLPLFPAMQDRDVDRVVSALRQFVERRR